MINVELRIITFLNI